MLEPDQQATDTQVQLEDKESVREFIFVCWSIIF